MGTPTPRNAGSNVGSFFALAAIAATTVYGSAASARSHHAAASAVAVTQTALASTSTSSTVGGAPDQSSTLTPAETPLVIFVDHHQVMLSSSAPTVGAALASAGIRVGASDRVEPLQTAALPNNGIVRVERVVSWTQNICSRVEAGQIFHDSTTMQRGTTHLIANGNSGLRQTTIRFTSIDGRESESRVLATRMIRESHPRIVARGVATPNLDRVADSAFEGTGSLAHSAMSMIATAYTAFCAGCSGTGRGATGMTVQHGVVAVDPRIIPLGSKLFIPGYGHAVAGDTGGAIIGSRIDLAFNSYGEAMNFGRRPVLVYLLDH